MKRISQDVGAGKNKRAKIMSREIYEGSDWDVRMEMIKALIPIGLMAVQEELENEISAIAGARYKRDTTNAGICRYGTNPGHVRLGGQKILIRVPRVRDLQKNQEMPLRTIEEMRSRDAMDDLLFKRVIYGISCKNYEKAAMSTPGAMGLSASSVSREFIQKSGKHLRELQERDLGDLDVVAIVLDGKIFAEDAMIVAMGITMTGEMSMGI